MQTKLSNSNAVQPSSTATHRSIPSPLLPFPRRSPTNAPQVCQARVIHATVASVSRPAKPCAPTTAARGLPLSTSLPRATSTLSDRLEPLAFLLLTVASVLCVTQNAITASRLPETVALLSRWIHSFLG